jgi:hypothetical protein
MSWSGMQPLGLRSPRPLTGSPAEEGHPDDPYRVYADPVGHPFCATEVG